MTFKPKMHDSGKLPLKPFGVFAAALAWTFVSTLIAGGIMTVLPRPMQGEAPELPKVLCLGMVFAVQFAVPAFVVLVIAKGRSLRIACLVAVACAMLVHHQMLEGFDLLDKAWRRGL